MDSEFFTASSEAWRANKISAGTGAFKYRCAYIHSNGQRCTKARECNEIIVVGSKSIFEKPPKSDTYCKRHLILTLQQSRGGA